MKSKIVIAALLLAGSAQAANQQGANVQLSLEVSGTCSLDVNGIQGFGAWPTGSTGSTGVALGSLGVNCAAGVAYAVGIDAGQHYEGAYRRMGNGGVYVPYVLRVGGSNGPEWGDTGLSTILSSYMETHPAPAVQENGDGSLQSFSLWGDADISDAPAGTYSDTVNVTVVW
jgi:spore coat protein U-like protein